jgi:hypothetical protein
LCLLFLLSDDSHHLCSSLFVKKKTVLRPGEDCRDLQDQQAGGVGSRSAWRSNPSSRIRGRQTYKSLVSKKSKGKIVASIADPILRRNAKSEGWLAQGNHLLHNGVTTSQYLELEGDILRIKHQNGGSTMTACYGNLLEDRAAVQRSRNTRIDDLPPRDERRGIDAIRESPRPSGGSK